MLAPGAGAGVQLVGGGYDPRELDPSGRLNESKEATLNISTRFRCPTLLLWGSISGIAGFILAFFVGLIDYKINTTSELGIPYPSGNGYWPSTVSEMVHDWNSPQGRIFFGLCLISVWLIFNSWYPFELRNVFTGNEQMGRLFCSIYWITFRQAVPVMGLLLLICVSTVPADVADITDEFSVAVHLLGAFLMFIGYIVAELKCLEFCGFKGKFEQEYLSIEPDERVCRIIVMVVVLIFYIAFCVFQGVMIVAPTDDKLCCHDKYLAKVVNLTLANSSVAFNAKAMVDTASGNYLWVKMASFTTEVIAGLALIFSHIVIWYYCEERHVEFGAMKLAEVYDEGHDEEEGDSYDEDA